MLTWEKMMWGFFNTFKGTGATDALAPLRQRYNGQHYNLLKFYFECSNLKYLTSLIDVPKLPNDPPSLIEASTPKLPKRPSPAESTPPAQPSPEPVIDFWSEQQAKQQRDASKEELIRSLQSKTKKKFKDI